MSAAVATPAAAPMARVRARIRTAAKQVLNHPLWGPDGQRAVWIIALFGMLLITLLWTAALARIFNEHRLIREAVTRQVESVAATLEQRTLLTIANADATALLVKYLYERDGHVDIGELIANGLIPSGAYLVVSLADDNGKVASSSDPRAVGLDIAGREYFTQHREDAAATALISRPVRLPLTGRDAVQVTRRLNHIDGSFAGIVLLSVDPEIFTDFYNPAIQGDMGTLALVGIDGLYRARRVGMQPTTTPTAPPTIILKNVERAPVGHFEALSPIDGMRRVAAYRKLRDYPLVVVASVAELEFLAPFRERRATYLWTVSIATFVVVNFFAIISALAFFLKESRHRAWERARQLALASKVYETTADGIMVSDSDDRIVMINAAFTKLTGFTPADLLGMRVAESPFRPLDPAAARARMDKVRTDGVHTGEVDSVAKDGSPLSLWITATCALDRDGTLNNYVRVFTDISLLKATQKQLEELATLDSLTGLPNRRLLQDRLAQALLRAKRNSTRMALMFVDLDGFKAVNDTLGHAAGDRLLQQTAARVQQCLRTNDTLARFGGDEFVVLLEGAQERSHAAVVGARILAAIAPVSASIGIVIYPLDGADADTLLKNADVAMYRAKCAGRNRYEFFGEAEAPPAAC